MEPLQRVTAPTLDVLAALLESFSAALDAAGPDSTVSIGTFGLDIMKRTGRPSGTIYPILERLERQGWITSAWEDHTTTQLHRRRVYSFTPEGRPAAEALLAARPAS